MFKVTISYREPTYEARNRPRDAPYRWTYTVLAEGAEQARRRALAEFHEVTRLSSVGWSRELIAVDIREAGPPLLASAR